MDARVSALEVGFQEMKGSLHRLELAFVRVEAALSNMATKADLALNTGAINALGEKVSAQGDRLTKVEDRLTKVEDRLTKVDEAIKSDVAASMSAMNALTAKVAERGERLTRVEAAIEETIKIALGKTISPWQVPAILAVSVALIGVLMAAFNWAGHQPWFPH